MGYGLKEALKTICGVNHWSYAVFWKIGCQNPKLLIWEDCYYELMSCFPSNFQRPMLDHLTNCWPSNGACAQQLSHVDERVHFLVNKMMMANQVHVVGQGLVGRTAFAGDHEWIVFGSFNEMVYPPEVLSEVHLQFSAGMQTVAVIPMMPHGVIQLGSPMAMMEDFRFIQDVKTLIRQLVCVPSALLSGNTERDGPVEELGSPFNRMKDVSLDPYGYMNNFSSNVAFDVGTQADLCEGLNIAVSGETDQMPSGGEDLFDAFGVDFKNRFLNGCISRSSIDGPDMVNQMKGKSLDFSTSFSHPDCDNMSESCVFSVNGSDHLLDAVVSGVQSGATQSSSEDFSCMTTFTKGNISSVPSISQVYGLCSESHQMDELFEYSRPSVDVRASSPRRAFGKNGAENCAQTTSYSGSHVSSWVDQVSTGELEKTVATASSKNYIVPGKPTRKKLKHGENPRPRPKDRQMIQDRLKELREIIPNGAKCSIDALLEQTIKHMVFLQSVNKHADKLKQTVESKIIDKDGGLLQKDSFEGGATWAYEVGPQAKMCPIIVEDLHPPHQFLVEMLCEERGFFLEIADVIRGMGLTILKGVIEKRNDKIWAHFAVEANREITRMDIFLSLVHLMEHTMNNSNVPTKEEEGFNDYNAFMSPTFDPAACVSRI